MAEHHSSSLPEHEVTGAQPAIRPDLEWSVWFPRLLIDRRFASLDAHNSIHLRIRDLERAIADALPAEHHVPHATLRNVMRLETLPTHHTARGLAAALGVPELAILLMSGQLDKGAIIPLLGHAPAIIRTEAEYRAALSRLDEEIPNPQFREAVAQLLEREYHFGQWLETQLTTFGISAQEWERMRQDINSPDGRQRLYDALMPSGLATVPTADSEPESSIPREFTEAARDATQEMD